MTKNEISEKIKSTGLLPVFNHDDINVAKRALKASYDAGLRIFEWTNRSASASKIFNELQPFVRDECPELVIGAGTIFNTDMARRYVSLGADFIVSPVLDPDLSQVCKQLDKLWIPGTGTVTEIYQAIKWGADIVKVFPGNAAGGPSFIKAVLATLPHANLLPTGGVDASEENLKAWFDAGACCVGMGSKLFTKEIVEDEDPGRLVERLRSTLNKIEDLRGEA